MSYRIETIRFYVRETAPGRFPTALGRAAQNPQEAERATSPLCHVRLEMTGPHGERTFGCAADRLSVRWLDKRPERSKGTRLRDLAELVQRAGEIYQEEAAFENPFFKWRRCHDTIAAEGHRAGQEELTSTFASALLERAMLDGVCRLAGKPLFAMLQRDALGFEPASVHPELKGLRLADVLPPRPLDQLHIRHTVGLFDPLTDQDWPEEKRLHDGLPETLEECIDKQGLRYFKIKISGDSEQDLHRLARIWKVLVRVPQPVITLDANEAFEDLEAFEDFASRLEEQQLGLFQHILLIEQPLPRHLALDSAAAPGIRRIGMRKPVIIDESDSSPDAFRRAFALGYRGTSHKNCKGVFKSLLNKALLASHARQGQEVCMSAEDLQNLPVVPLHQDFAMVSVLGIEHCERNGHHYNFGLSMLSEKDKRSATEHHPDLYQRRGIEWFLSIRNGTVQCGSLQCPGFAVWDEPDWDSMQPLQDWIETRYPA